MENSFDKDIQDPLQKGNSPVVPNRRRKPTSSPDGKPPTEKIKMDTKIEGHMTKQLEDMKKMICDIRKDQQAIRQSLEKKIDRIGDNIQEILETEIKALREHMTMEINSLTNRLGNVEDRLAQLETCNKENEFPVDNTVVVLGLKGDVHEDLNKKCSELLQNGMGLRIQHKRCKRMKSFNNKPGLVKIELNTKEDKISVLRAKAVLKHENDYKKVFVRSSQTHEERLIRYNAQTLLNAIPDGQNYRITAGGKIVKKDGNEQQQHQHQQQQQQQQQRDGRAAGAGHG